MQKIIIINQGKKYILMTIELILQINICALKKKCLYLVIEEEPEGQ